MSLKLLPRLNVTSCVRPGLKCTHMVWNLSPLNADMAVNKGGRLLRCIAPTENE